MIKLLSYKSRDFHYNDGIISFRAKMHFENQLLDARTYKCTMVIKFVIMEGITLYWNIYAFRVASIMLIYITFT